LVLHTVVCPLFLLFGSRLQCFASPVSLVLALLSCDDSSPPAPSLPFLLFSGYILPRDCYRPTACRDPFLTSSIPSVCLSPLWSPFLNPALPLPLFQLYQRSLYNTHHLLLFRSPSISTRYQELEKAPIVFSRWWYSRITFIHSLLEFPDSPSRSSLQILS